MEAGDFEKLHELNAALLCSSVDGSSAPGTARSAAVEWLVARVSRRRSVIITLNAAYRGPLIFSSAVWLLLKGRARSLSLALLWRRCRCFAIKHLLINYFRPSDQRPGNPFFWKYPDMKSFTLGRAPWYWPCIGQQDVWLPILLRRSLLL